MRHTISAKVINSKDSCTVNVVYKNETVRAHASEQSDVIVTQKDKVSTSTSGLTWACKENGIKAEGFQIVKVIKASEILENGLRLPNREEEIRGSLKRFCKQTFTEKELNAEIKVISDYLDTVYESEDFQRVEDIIKSIILLTHDES